MREKRWEAVARLADGKRGAAQIAEELGMSIKHVHNAAVLARRHGRFVLLPRPHEKKRFGRPAQWRQVADLADGTLSLRQVSEKLGISIAAVKQGATWARREQGAKVRFKYIREKVRPSIAVRLDDGRIKSGGGIRQLVLRLPNNVGEWLVEQIPEGSTLSDLLVAIITDAYHEDNTNA